MTIVELIHKIKKRPELYLGRKSITGLKSFLDGYYFALMENNLPVNDDSNLLREFQKYVESKYHIKSSQNWSSIILFFSTDEHEGLDNFFNLFEDFCQSNRKTDKA